MTTAIDPVLAALESAPLDERGFTDEERVHFLRAVADVGNATVAAQRDALTMMLDRLGGDGVVPSLNGDTPEAVADMIYEHVQWLEARARCEALMDTLKAIDVATYERVMLEALGPRVADESAEQRGDLKAGEADKRHEARLRQAIVEAARRTVEKAS